MFFHANSMPLGRVPRAPSARSGATSHDCPPLGKADRRVVEANSLTPSWALPLVAANAASALSRSPSVPIGLI